MGLPTPTAVAPSANALKISDPLMIPPRSKIGTFSPIEESIQLLVDLHDCSPLFHLHQHLLLQEHLQLSRVLP